MSQDNFQQQGSAVPPDVATTPDADHHPGGRNAAAQDFAGQDTAGQDTAGGDAAGQNTDAGRHWWAPHPPEGSGQHRSAPYQPSGSGQRSGLYSYPVMGQYIADPTGSHVNAGDRPTGPSDPVGDSPNTTSNAASPPAQKQVPAAGQGSVPPYQSWTRAGSYPGAPGGQATAIGSPLFGERAYAGNTGAAGTGTSSQPVITTAPRRRGTLIAASTVALALLAGFGGGALASNLNNDPAAPVAGALATTGTSPAVSSVKPAPSGSVQQVADAILPSVVSVLSSSSSSEGEGSGVILSADGQILTNNHVIEGATDLQVQFNDGTTARATVVGADPVDDLAVIKAEGVSGLTPATLGTSADLQVGQDVVAVGSPLGLSATVTAGIVSALNRPVATSSAQDQQPQQQQLPGFGQQPQQQGQSQAAPAAPQSTVINAIQTDAAINPGNSGGPLVDMSGNVIGINSAIASLSSGTNGESGSIGVGFAIPIDQAKRIADEIVKTGKASHAVLGASVGDATVNGQALLTSGAKISQLTSGGGAEKAGLQVGDVITKVGEQKVESADALVAAVRSAAPNGTVSITYTRGGESKTVDVTLGSSD